MTKPDPASHLRVLDSKPLTAPVDIKKLERVAVLAFRNGLRLHDDSIRLFSQRRYPSSFALSVLATEEIGKYLMLETMIFAAGDSPWDPNDAEDLMGSTHRHALKQNFFARHAPMGTVTARQMRRIWDGALERAKHRSLYVGLPSRNRKTDLTGRIISPSSVSRREAQSQITIVNDYLVLSAVGVIEDYTTFDFEEMDEIITLQFVRRLKRRWPRMSRAAARELARMTPH